jgi:UDP-glucuronate 4-epimerase
VADLVKLLLTGAAGFIGFHTARALLERGDEVVGLDNLNAYYDPNLKSARLAILEREPRFRFVMIDVSDRAAMQELFEREKFQRVVHLAAQAGVRYSIQNPHVYVATNITGFLHVLEGCRQTQVEHLVYASTSSVYDRIAILHRVRAVGQARHGVVLVHEKHSRGQTDRCVQLRPSST